VVVHHGIRLNHGRIDSYDPSRLYGVRANQLLIDLVDHVLKAIAVEPHRVVDPDLIDLAKENSQFGRDQDFSVGIEKLKPAQDGFVGAGRFDRVDMRADAQLSLDPLLPLIRCLRM